MILFFQTISVVQYMERFDIAIALQEVPQQYET